jgi:hypothetical protein
MAGVRAFQMLFVLASILLPTNGAFYDNYNVFINTKQSVYETDHKFLSIALDSGLIRNRWRHFNFKSEKVHSLAKGLAPAYLRIGGTNGDFLLFNPNEKTLTPDRINSKLLSREMSLRQPRDLYARSDKVKDTAPHSLTLQ